MNKDWSDKNKKMQTLISKEATFDEGIKVLLELRAELLMPFSRHWIMHVEAMNRIKDKLK